MSSNFLQRFKGKTQTISKDGVHNILGGSTDHQNGANPYLYTHSNGLTTQQKYNSIQSQNINSFKNTTQSINKKPTSQQKMSVTNTSLNEPKIKTQNNQKDSIKKAYQNQQKVNPPDNPFLISNPFYLDEQQKIRQQALQKQMLKQKLQLQQKKIQQNKKSLIDSKKQTYSSSINPRNTSFNKKTQKQWTKLGGLGPNIGGDEWQEKKKKLQKMQEFANQVKAVNLQKGLPIPKIVSKGQQKKEDPRSKALQYSKKVPKPKIKTYDKSVQQQEQSQNVTDPDKQQLSELQQYELRHKQLQQILKNQKYKQ